MAINFGELDFVPRPRPPARRQDRRRRRDRARSRSAATTSPGSLQPGRQPRHEFRHRRPGHHRFRRLQRRGGGCRAPERRSNRRRGSNRRVFLPSTSRALRYDPSGTLDPRFDQDGKTTIDFGGGDFASDLAVQPDGKVVVGGTTGSPAQAVTSARTSQHRRQPRHARPRPIPRRSVRDGRKGHHRLRGRGRLGDVSRARASGKIVVRRDPPPVESPGPTAAEDSPEDLTIQRDGRIVVAGAVVEHTDGPAFADFALARYLVRGCCIADGSPAPGPPGPLP